MNLRINHIAFVENYLTNVLDESVHAKRIRSLADATIGVITSVSLAVSIIGQSLAHAKRLTTKHAVKQVDRLLSNKKIVVWDMFEEWVKEVVGKLTTIRVAMDWTDFDADDQSTLALNLVTPHGRATPLMWLTVLKDELKGRRNDWEDLCLSHLAKILPEGVAVTILADRGFGDTKLFDFLAPWDLAMPSAFAAISRSPRRRRDAARLPMGRKGRPGAHAASMRRSPPPD